MKRLLLSISFILFLLNTNGQAPTIFGMGIGTLQPPSSGYDPDAAAYFAAIAAATTPLTSTVKMYINTLVVSAKSNSWWSIDSAIYPVPNTDALACVFNLKNPNTYKLTLHSTPTITGAGITWNGSSQYAQTGLNASTNLAVDNVSFTYYTPSTTSASNGSDIGCYDGTRGDELWIQSFGNTTTNMNTSSGVVFSNATIKGLYIASRVSSTDERLYIGGVQKGSTYTTASGSTKPNLEIYLGCDNQSGAPSNYVDRTCGYADIGAGVNSTLAATKSTDIQTYLTSMGR